MTTEEAHTLTLEVVSEALTKSLGRPVKIEPLSDKEHLGWTLRNARDFLRQGNNALALAEIEHALAKQQ